MRKCLLWAVILFLAMHPLRLALADSPFYQDGAFSYTLTDEGAVLRDWQGWPAGEEQVNLLLPDTLGSHPLIGIGAYAMGISYQFDHRNRFCITLPEGVRYLEENAFDSCCNATMLVLPSTLQQIGEGFLNVFAEVSFPNGSAYFSCENGFLLDLRSNTLLYAAPSSHDYPLPSVTRLGNSCLDNWLAERTDVVLPTTLTSIGAVFYDMPELEHALLPDSVTALDAQCATGITGTILADTSAYYWPILDDGYAANGISSDEAIGTVLDEGLKVNVLEIEGDWVRISHSIGSEIFGPYYIPSENILIAEDEFSLNDGSTCLFN